MLYSAVHVGGMLLFMYMPHGARTRSLSALVLLPYKAFAAKGSDMNSPYRMALKGLSSGTANPSKLACSGIRSRRRSGGQHAIEHTKPYAGLAGQHGCVAFSLAGLVNMVY